jgi:hypothetical protein
VQRVVDDRQIIEDIPGFVDRIVVQLAIRRFLGKRIGDLIARKLRCVQRSLL